MSEYTFRSFRNGYAVRPEFARVQYNEIPPHVEYSLSEAGKELYTVFVEMGRWGSKYLD